MDGILGHEPGIETHGSATGGAGDAASDGGEHGRQERKVGHKLEASACCDSFQRNMNWSVPQTSTQNNTAQSRRKT